jgi:crossover junction endodeoxyribonuclease RusA
MTLLKPEGEVRAAISWPPSVNNLFFNVPGRGRVPSKEYQHWKQEAGWELKAQKPQRFTVPVEITVELNPPTKRAFDPDGKLKAVIDLLVAHQVIADDNFNHVRSVTARIVEVGAPCTVVVRPI